MCKMKQNPSMSSPHSTENQPSRLTVNIVRYGELIPCKDAFIDTHTPGSNLKENFSIIGAGVSENSNQHVHIRQKIGFNIGAAGQPPHCRNSLHAHNTAEVFFVKSGRWRFFWGRWGTAGSVVLEAGDIFNIPTGIFRGFENIGTDYGMIMAILGGDDAGGGVTWAPQVIEEAQQHGLILGDNHCLYNTKKGESLPDGVKPMPVLTDQELKNYPETEALDIIPNYVARYHDLVALAQHQPAKVIGADAILRDRPGFTVDFLTRGGFAETAYSWAEPEVLMPIKGHWHIQWHAGETILDTVLNPGDTCLIPANIAHKLSPSMSGEVALFRIRKTADPAGPTWTTF